MGSYDLDVDADSNRSYLTFEGMLDEAEADAAVTEVESVVDELDDGFDLVLDISSFRPVSQDVTDRIERGKESIAAGGLSASVRVTGESITGTMQLERVGEDVESYHVGTAATVDAAEDLLDDLRDYPSMRST